MRRLMLCMFLSWVGSLSHSIQGAEPLCHDLIQSLEKGEETEVALSTAAYIQSRLLLEASQINETKKTPGFVSWFDLLHYGVLNRFFIDTLSKSLQSVKTSILSPERIDQSYRLVKQEVLDRLRQELQAHDSTWSAPAGREERQKFDIFYWRLCEALAKMPVELRVSFLFHYSDAVLAQVAVRVHAPEKVAAQEAWWKRPDSKPYLWEVLYLEEMETMQKIIGPFLQECTEKVCVTWEKTGHKSLVSIEELLQLPNEKIHTAQGQLLPCTVWSQLFDGVIGENWTLANTTTYMRHLQSLKGMTEAHKKVCLPCHIKETEEEDFWSSFVWLEVSHAQFLEELQKESPPPSPAASFHSAQEEWEEEWDLCGVMESLKQTDNS